MFADIFYLLMFHLLIATGFYQSCGMYKPLFMNVLRNYDEVIICCLLYRSIVLYTKLMRHLCCVQPQATIRCCLPPGLQTIPKGRVIISVISVVPKFLFSVVTVIMVFIRNFGRGILILKQVLAFQVKKLLKSSEQCRFTFLNRTFCKEFPLLRTSSSLGPIILSFLSSFFPHL